MACESIIVVFFSLMVTKQWYIYNQWHLDLMKYIIVVTIKLSTQDDSVQRNKITRLKNNLDNVA